jgi:hypothetical protein
MRAEVADHGAQRSRNEHADPIAGVRLGSRLYENVQKFFLNCDDLEKNGSTNRYRKKNTEKAILLILRSTAPTGVIRIDTS